MASKKTNIFLLWIVGVVTLLVVLALVKTTLNKHVGFELKSSTSSIAKDTHFTVDVYLDEMNGQEVTAYDIQIDYDKTKAKLISADSGGYLTNPLVVKWDLDSGWFSAAANPSSYKDSFSRTDPTKPILSLTFMAVDATASSTISVKDGSEVYVAEKGGVSPAKAQFHYSIK